MAHVPVMLEEVVAYLLPVVEFPSLCIDATVGDGGHSAALLAAAPALSVICVDRDGDILERAKRHLSIFKDRVCYVQAWFDEFLAGYRGAPPQAVLFDLGVSSFQLRTPQRGFSFRLQAPLDMRLSTSQSTDASDILRRSSRAELTRIFSHYGEERFAAQIAQSVVERRKRAPILDTQTFNSVVVGAIPPRYRYRGRIHPATRCYQALRIAVNNELERITRAVPLAFELLARGGRVLCIAFHSLEDRIVKHTFRNFQSRHRAEILTPRPVRPSAREIRTNPPSRSACLRVVKKIPGVLQDR